MAKGYKGTAWPMGSGPSGNARASVYAQSGAAKQAQTASQGAKSGAGAKWSQGVAHATKNR